MAHDEHGAGEVHEPFLQHLERLGVEVVGGLVEHDQVGRLGEEPGQEHAVPLATGEKLHRRAGAVGREQEVLQVADHVPRLAADLHRLIAVRHVVGHGLLVVELVAKLIEEGDSEIGAEPHHAGGWRELAEHEPQQRRLARTVGADDADAVAAHHGDGEIADDRPRAAQERHAVDRRHERPAAIGLLDIQLHPACRSPPPAALPPHRLQSPHPSLVAGAAGLDPGADPGLFLGELLVKERVLFFFRGQGLLLADEERVVVARPVEDPAAVDFEDSIRHAAEERAIVGDEHERAPPAAQKLLEPLDRCDVEMVGRLVEQEQVGLPDDGPRQQHAALHACGKGLKGRAAVEPRPREHLCDGVVVLPGRLGGRRRQAGRDDCMHRTSDILGHVLLEQGDRRPRCEGHLARIGLDRSRDQPHERRLAGAVAAQEADPLPGLDVAGHVVEERRAAKPERQVAKGDERHP